MDWRSEAAHKLMEYSAKKASIENLTEEIRELQCRRRSIKSPTVDRTLVTESTTNQEDRLLNMLVLQKELEENLRVVNRWVKRVEKALDELSEEEKIVLMRFFINPEKGAAERLSLDLGIDRKTVYYRRKRAIAKFTYALYGRLES